MNLYRASLAFLVVATPLLLLGCGGCADQARQDLQASDAAENSPPPSAQASEEAAPDAGDWYSLNIRPQVPGGLPITEEWFFVTGETDEKNRYRSTVRVMAQVPGTKRTLKVCSGVLVGPPGTVLLVLTTGQRHRLLGKYVVVADWLRNACMACADSMVAAAQLCPAVS